MLLFKRVYLGIQTLKICCTLDDIYTRKTLDDALSF